MAFYRIDSRLFAKDPTGWRWAAVWCQDCWHQWDARFHRLAEVDLLCPVCETKVAIPPMRKWFR